MNTDSNFYRSIAYFALATGALLLIPLISMQFSADVVWTIFDFIFAGTLIFCTGLTYKLLRESRAILLTGLLLDSRFLPGSSLFGQTLPLGSSAPRIMSSTCCIS